MKNFSVKDEIKMLALNSSNLNENHLIFGHKEEFAIEIEPTLSGKLKYNSKTFKMEKVKVFRLKIYDQSKIILDLPYSSMWEVKGRIRQFNTNQLR